MLTIVGSGENTLHWMISCVPGIGGSSLVAGSAQVIVVAYQALEPQAPKVSFDAGITANTCKRAMEKQKRWEIKK